MPVSGQRLVYENGDWEVDLARHELRARGVPVPIAGRAFEIIEILVQSAGELVTKGDLMDRVWPGAIVEENTIQVHMSAIRKALGHDRGMLQTAFGRGYRLLGDWTVRHQTNAIDQADLIGMVPSRDPPFITNLPLAASDLIGRTPTVRHLQELLSAYRVVTLTGPGGIGKTVLALEVARGLSQTFRGDIWFVELVSLLQPRLVPSAVAGVLGLKLGGDEVSPESLARAIGGRKLLLVLDNCEHVIDVAAAVAEAVVHMCPHASVLATSREVLRIEGEYVYRVPPLDVPSEQQEEPKLVLEHSAVQLFMARTRAQHFNFSPTGDDLAAVASICRHLDGIPLAIEFAAARAAALGLPEIASRLNDRFGLLTGGRRTALPRHQTLRAALDWSYELLPQSERWLLRRLAIFPSGFTLDAAIGVMKDTSNAASAVVENMANLVAKSLVTLDGTTTPERWRLLETVRAYALEKLAESGEAQQTARYHAEFFRDLVTMSSRNVQTRAAAENWARCLRETDNVRVALDWAFSSGGDAALGADLTAGYVPVWMQQSLLGECRARVDTALAALDRGAGYDRGTEMMLRAALGMSLTYTRGPVNEARLTWERVFELATDLGDTEYRLQALYGLWLQDILVCEYRAAAKFAQEFQDVAGRDAAATDIPTADRMMALTLHYLGDQAAARVCADRSLSGSVRADRHVDITHYGIDQRVGALVLLSRVLWLQGFPDQAVQAAKASVDEAVTLDHGNSICLAVADGASIIAIMTGNAVDAKHFATMLRQYADKHVLGVWRTYAHALQGRLLMQDGAVSDGAALLKSALDDLHDTPFDIRFQLYLVWLAEVQGAAGNIVEALGAIDEALTRAERMDERWYFPELLRIRGELLLRSDAVGSAAASSECFAQSLDVARNQGALSWELRTTISFIRSRQDKTAAAELRVMLKSVLARFSEGFGTADLIAARRLLTELEA